MSYIIWRVHIAAMEVLRRSLFRTSSGVLRYISGANCCDGSHDQSDVQQRLTAKIMRETQVSRQHLTPEIALHLITPECRLFSAPVTPDSAPVFDSDPFWGFYWPGGQALSRYILDHAELVAGKSVLDVGSGCGATSLAALMCRAKYALANDIDEAAACAALMNASLNGIRRSELRTSASNLIGSRIDEDIMLLGDMFYDAEFAATLIPWLQRLNADGKQIFVGDPGRHCLTEAGEELGSMEKLATYELPANCCIENHGFKHVNVWRFR